MIKQNSTFRAKAYNKQYCSHTGVPLMYLWQTIFRIFILNQER